MSTEKHGRCRSPQGTSVRVVVAIYCSVDLVLGRNVVVMEGGGVYNIKIAGLLDELPVYSTVYPGCTMQCIHAVAAWPKFIRVKTKGGQGPVGRIYNWKCRQ